MPDVVTPFDRQKVAPIAHQAPRHRREGEFDEDNQWHDAADSPLAANG